MDNVSIAIRSIQHYLYCPHRWGLVEIGRVWAENYFVTKAQLMHERVHNPESSYISRGKKVFTDLWVYNDDLGLYGKTDCIEATPDKDGCTVDDSCEKYKLCIVEYKPTAPQNQNFNFDDSMQVFAQKLCTDYVFNCDCDTVIYYADIKKRVKLPLREKQEEYLIALEDILEKMRQYLKNGKIPEKPKRQKCSGCSFKDVCMPRIKTPISIRREIEELTEDRV